MARRILAIIPARSGSRGLRNKNIKLVGGLPMLVRAIGLALSSRRRGETWDVLVSTDSEKYAKMARRAGAQAPWLRPKRLATNRARLIDAVVHALTRMQHAGHSYDAVVMLSAATPLTSSRDVRAALKLFRTGRGESVVSVRSDPIPASWRFDLHSGRLHATCDSPVGRRQQTHQGYCLNGAIYIASPRWLHEHHRFLVEGRSRALLMPKERSVDVEDRWDLALVRLMLQNG